MPTRALTFGITPVVNSPPSPNVLPFAERAYFPLSVHPAPQKSKIDKIDNKIAFSFILIAFPFLPFKLLLLLSFVAKFLSPIEYQVYHENSNFPLAFLIIFLLFRHSLTSPFLAGN